MEHWVAESNVDSALKLTARDRILPSTSGNTTCMARSRAESPWLPARQSASLPPEKTTWSTGAFAESNGVALRTAPGEESAKAVALSTTAGFARSIIAPTKSAATASFRLVA